MGRPRLYHTPEQQRIANRAKSQRHYQRNKTKLQDRRRSDYRESVLKNSAVNSKRRDLGYWYEKVAQLSTKFDTLVDTHPAKYVDTLLSTYYASSGSKDILGDAVLTFSGYQKSIQHYEDEILQLGGVDLEWREANKLFKRVREVVHWVEEISCLATVDPAGLIALHAKEQLMYQVA